MNTALSKRLRKLETKLVPPVDQAGMRLVALLRERRRRCRAAEGRDPEEGPLREDFYDPGSHPQTLTEALRRGRFQRLASA